MQTNRYPYNSQKKTFIYSLFVLCLCICIAGCIQVPATKNKASDTSPASEVQRNTISSDTVTTPIRTPVSEQIFPPGMPLQIREKIMREGKIPTNTKIRDNTGAPGLTPTPVPNNTSQVTRLDDTYPEDYFTPSRNSIYFSYNSQDRISGALRPMYSESSIPLNNTLKNRQIYVEKSPFSVRFVVHPKSNPLVSWAKITVVDPFQNPLYVDGYNREFSSEQTKEFTVYRNGTSLLQISGEAATLDLTINTPDGTLQPGTSPSTEKGEAPEDLPPQIRERLLREGKL